MGKKSAWLDEAVFARRRDVIQAALVGLGGLTASGLIRPRPGRRWQHLPTLIIGPVVSPDPITAAIAKSSVQVELVEFSKPPPTSQKYAKAMLNFLYSGRAIRPTSTATTAGAKSGGSTGAPAAPRSSST